MRKRPSARVEEPLTNSLLTGLKRTLRAQPLKAGIRKQLLAMGYIERNGWDAFSKLTPAGLNALRNGKPE